MLSYLIFNFSFSLTLRWHIRCSSDVDAGQLRIGWELFAESPFFLDYRLIMECDLKIVSFAWRENI